MRTETLQLCIEQALSGGVTLVQLREKHLDTDSFIELGIQIKHICDAHDVPLVINDRVDVALESGAAGVHIGQGDMSAAQVRALLGPDRILGVSVTNIKEALKAEADGADYLGVGAMFATQTKADASYVSLETLAAIRDAVHLPIVTIGGLDERTIPLCGPCRVQGFAVVSALVDQPDVSLAARKLKLCAKSNAQPVPS
jgi:thiamine-phosphate pyrophosphorylase